MNKLIKTGIGVGVLLVAAGITMTVAASVLGASSSRISSFLEDRFPFYHGWDDEIYDLVEEGSSAEFTAAGEEAASYTGQSGLVYSDEESWEAWYPMVSLLEIEQNGGNVTMRLSDDDSMAVTGNGADFSHVSYRESPNNGRLLIRASDGENYIITVPGDWYMGKMEVKVRRGLFSGEMPGVHKAEFLAEGGQIEVRQNGGDNVELTARNKGVLSWRGMEGAISYLEGEAEDASLSIELPPDMSMEEYSCQLDVEDGKIALPYQVYEGDQELLLGEGSLMMELDAKDGGSITVTEQ